MRHGILKKKFMKLLFFSDANIVMNFISNI